MHLEILMGHDARKSYHPIEKDNILIGSSRQCDVVIPSTEVSRRHLSLLRRGERFYVIDHASTNGSWLHDEKITPGVKVEWDASVSLRLAGGAILTLIDDDEVPAGSIDRPEGSRPKEDRTQVVSMDKLRAVRAPVRKAKKKPKPKGMGKAWILVIALFAAAWYLHGWKTRFDAARKAQIEKTKKKPSAGSGSSSETRSNSSSSPR